MSRHPGRPRGARRWCCPWWDNVLAWRSLLVGGLRLHSLAIERPRLAVRRDAAGVLLRVGGPSRCPPEASGDHRRRRLDPRPGGDPGAQRRDRLDRTRSAGAPPLSLSGRRAEAAQMPDMGTWSGLSARAAGGRSASGLDRARPSSPAARRTTLAAWSGRLYLELGLHRSRGRGPARGVDYPVDVQRGTGRPAACGRPLAEGRAHGGDRRPAALRRRGNARKGPAAARARVP